MNNFKLEWDELDDDLKDEKIEQYIAAQGEDGDVNEKEAEHAIKAHFPIYF